MGICNGLEMSDGRYPSPHRRGICNTPSQKSLHWLKERMTLPPAILTHQYRNTPFLITFGRLLSRRSRDVWCPDAFIWVVDWGCCWIDPSNNWYLITVKEENLICISLFIMLYDPWGFNPFSSIFSSGPCVGLSSRKFFRTKRGNWTRNLEGLTQSHSITSPYNCGPKRDQLHHKFNTSTVTVCHTIH